MSFVPVVESIELGHKEILDVKFVPVKTVMYSPDKTSDAMHMVYSDADSNKSALARFGRTEPEEEATTYNPQRRSVGKHSVNFTFGVTTGKPAGAEGVVSNEDLLVIHFPDALFKHEVSLQLTHANACVVIDRPARS